MLRWMTTVAFACALLGAAPWSVFWWCLAITIVLAMLAPSEKKKQ